MRARGRNACGGWRGRSTNSSSTASRRRSRSSANWSTIRTSSPATTTYTGWRSGWRAEAMASRDDVVLEITPQVLLKAYAVGIFPMAESAEDPGLYWIEPEQRGIIPLDDFHVPRRLARTVASGRFEVRIDH